MSLSNVNFYAQNEQEKMRANHQQKINDSYAYLRKNNIDYNTLNTQHYVDGLSKNIKHIINIHDCYINKHLNTYEFTSTFNGLLVHVTGEQTKIYEDDHVVVKPLSVVYIGEHIKEYTKQNTTISKVKCLQSKQHPQDLLTCVLDIKTNQTQPLLTSVDNLFAKTI